MRGITLNHVTDVIFAISSELFLVVFFVFHGDLLFL